MRLYLIVFVCLTYALVFCATHYVFTLEYSNTSQFPKEKIDNVQIVQNDKVFQNKSEDLKLSPVILVPGLEGSQMQARLHKNHSNHIYCWRSANDYYPIWVSLEELVEPMVNCFMENMQLTYDPITHRTHNTPGVDVFVPGFGETESVERLSSSHFEPHFGYFDTVVDALVASGYVKGVSVRGAPYDFRRAPNEHQAFFNDLKKLIEDTVEKNEKRPAIIVCHSMGCLFSLHLLNLRVNSSWKKKHIRHFYTISAPWSGAFKALKTLTTGDNMGIFLYSGKEFREMEQSFPSIAFLMPTHYGFSVDKPLVSTPSFNYTVMNYEKLFERMNRSHVAAMQRDTAGLLRDLRHPGVPITCVYGTGMKTDYMLLYENDNDFPDKPTVLNNMQGDSTVNLPSLEHCLRWSRQRKFAFHSQKINPADHLDILHDNTMVDELVKTVLDKKYSEI